MNNKVFTSTIDQIREIAIQYPRKVAVVLDEEQITYKEFIEQVDAFSYYLVNKYDVENQDYIVFCMDRSIECIIVLVSILNIGCVYIPIDPANSKNIHLIVC